MPDIIGRHLGYVGACAALVSKCSVVAERCENEMKGVRLDAACSNVSQFFGVTYWTMDEL